MKCRHCGAEATLTMIDLGSAPPSNAYLTEVTLHRPEKWFPLRVLVCEECWLAQTEDFSSADELFDADYAYFSGYSNTWLAHCKRYVADMVSCFGIDANSHVVEIAANDGYLLQFVKERNIPCTGVEPTASTAAAARAKGIPIVEDFFGVNLALQMAEKGMQADLTVANNVLAHVPDINDFVSGFAILLKTNGVATFEFPHLMQLIEGNQFDTIYHEHFSYLSLTAVTRIFEQNGLAVFDVEELPTHGGSLRVYAQRREDGKNQITNNVYELLQRESLRGMTATAYYAGFQEKADRVKDDLVCFLIEARRKGQRVAGYGAAAKGNTLLNYAGVRHDLLPYVVDLNPAKQGKYLPGSRIPILPEGHLRTSKPDLVLVLPWNIRDEIITQLSYIRQWGGRFLTAVPALEDI
jgi:SAM-dependent methyltransferase